MNEFDNCLPMQLMLAYLFFRSNISVTHSPESKHKLGAPAFLAVVQEEGSSSCAENRAFRTAHHS